MKWRDEGIDVLQSILLVIIYFAFLYAPCFLSFWRTGLLHWVDSIILGKDMFRFDIYIPLHQHHVSFCLVRKMKRNPQMKGEKSTLSDNDVIIGFHVVKYYFVCVNFSKYHMAGSNCFGGWLDGASETQPRQSGGTGFKASRQLILQLKTIDGISLKYDRQIEVRL